MTKPYIQQLIINVTMVKKAKDTTGITIISVIGILLSLLGIIGGLIVVGVGSFGVGLMAMMGYGQIVSKLMIALGVVSLIVSVAGLVGFIFLSQMKKIGWQIVMAVSIFNIITAMAMFSIFSVLVWGVIAYYVYPKKDQFKK